MVPLKYLSNFWRALEFSLMNCEICCQLIWPKKCFIVAGSTTLEFKVTDAKLYVPVVILSIQDNIRLLKQLECGFKRTINWNLCKSTNKARNSKMF